MLIDSELELWQEYENEGWPARYLFDGRARLFEYHYGEGAYEETELAIQELLGVEREPLAPLRPEDAPGALLRRRRAEQPGAYAGPYEAGGVWAVLDGAGESVRAGADATAGRRARMASRAPTRCEHERHTAGELRWSSPRACAALRRASRPACLATSPPSRLAQPCGATRLQRPSWRELRVRAVAAAAAAARAARRPRRARTRPASRGSRRAP